MMKVTQTTMSLVGSLFAVTLCVGYLGAQEDKKDRPWDAEVRSVLTDAMRRLKATTDEQNWSDEVQNILTDAAKQLGSTSSGPNRTEEIHGAIAEASKRLKAITDSGPARDDQLRTILSDVSSQLQAIPQKSFEPGQGGTEAVGSLQANAPKITPIKGGYFADFGNLTEIGAVQLGGPMTGKFEIFFESRLEDVDAEAKPIANPDFLLVLADYWIVRGKPERAIPLYETGLEKDPNNFLFMNNLALLTSTAGNDHDKALNIIDGALKDRADNVTLLDTKGLILMNASRPDEATPVLQRAVELSCQKPLCVMHYANALDMQGAEQQAKEWFNKVQPLLESSVNTFLKDDKNMFDYLKGKYNTSLSLE